VSLYFCISYILDRCFALSPKSKTLVLAEYKVTHCQLVTCYKGSGKLAVK